MLLVEMFLYYIDLWKRSALFHEAMSKREELQKYLERSQDSKVLIFPYKIVLSGSDLLEAINYDLIIISKGKKGMRPYVYFDPKAGRGPGICGSKEKSEIGEAIRRGHPVYFVTFRPDPEEGQTMEKVFHGIAYFVEHVASLHPDEKDPALIGNCQAGWMILIVAARYLKHRECPLKIVASPASYWGGTNSMKYKGFLSGGSFWAAFLADLNGGIFDGANLSGNFEFQDGSQVMGSKLFSLFFDPEMETEQFLENERWWNFFCHMTKEEIVWIVKNLFIGNKLELGTLEVEGEIVDLRSIRGLIVLFFSRGDTITSPEQAINWVNALYKHVAEIKAPIVYVVHPSCGHLAIFVSSDVAADYHSVIYDELENMASLEGGLYELVIEPKLGHKLETRDLSDTAQFVERRDAEQENEFLAKLSEHSDRLHDFYEKFWGPGIRMTCQVPHLAKESNFMRASRRVPKNFLGDFFSPFFAFIPDVPDDNSYRQYEKLFMDHCVDWWKYSEKTSASLTHLFVSMASSLY